MTDSSLVEVETMEPPIEQFIGKLGFSQELTDAQMEAIVGGSGRIIYLNAGGGTYTAGFTYSNNLGPSLQTKKHIATITHWHDWHKTFVLDGQCGDKD